MSWVQLVLVSMTGFIGATLQGTVGFGMGIVASPLLVLLDERFVPAPILLSTLVLTTFLTLRERYAVDVQGMQSALVGRLVGTVIAGLVLTVLPADRMSIVFGAFVIVGVLMSISGIRFRPGTFVLVVAGTLSGIMGTIASIGGPAMALVYQDAEGARIRATMSSIFWFGTIISLIILRLVGMFGSDEIRLTLILLPGMLIGLYTSQWTARFIDRGYTRAVVLVTASATGIIVITRHLM